MANLFNVVLCIGWFPEIWVNSVLLPLYKKGSVKNTDNFRGMSLVSHVRKLFTSVIRMY